MGKATRWTDEKIKALKLPTGTQERRLLVAPNLYLYLRTLKAGGLSRQWQYRAQVNGKRRWLSIGSYPEVGLASAERQRFGHDRALDAARKGEGEHPTIVARKARGTLAADPLVKDAFEDWLASRAISSPKKDGKPVRQRTLDLHRDAFRDVLPVIGEYQVGKLTAADLRKCLARPLKRGSPGAARMVHKSLRAFISYCMEVDHIPESAPDPMSRVKNPKPYRPKRPHPANDEEIKFLLKMVFSSEMDLSTRLVIELGVLTGLRPGESRLLKWDRVNLGRSAVFLGGDDVKTDEAFRIHLSAPALALLKIAKTHAGSTPYVFPGRVPMQPLGVTTVNTALKRTFGTTGLDGSGRNVKPHDLRKTFRTMLSRLGIDPEVSGLCLNHSEDDVLRKIYDGHDYRPQMADAWEKAGLHIERLKQDLVREQAGEVYTSPEAAQLKTS